MSSAVKDRTLLPQSVLAVSPERLIAFGRLALTLFALIAIWLDPPQIGSQTGLVYVVVCLYLGFALCGVGIVMRRTPNSLEQLFAHGADIACVALLMYLNQGPSSPFFVFFTFILLAATLRWDWQGAIGTTGLLVAVFVVLILLIETGALLSEIGELSRAIIRPAFLMVAGAMLGYVGAVQEHSRIRLAKLVAWPGPDTSQELPVPVASALAHAAGIMQAPRLIVVWEQPDEPYREIVLWLPHGLDYNRERSDRFGTLVAPEWTEKSFTFSAGGAREHSSPSSMIDEDLRNTFSIRNGFTAPFSLPLCTGRIFIMDQSKPADREDLLLAELIAARIGVDLEHHLLRSERAAAAALAERARLARDLHDGVLQGLAAADIHLKLSSTQVDEAAADRLAGTRLILTTEQQRIRTFVEDTRFGSGPSARRVDLKAQLEKIRSALSRQWECRVNLELDPHEVQVAENVARHVRHLLTEAVSNAVRHGKASCLDVRVQASDGVLRLMIRDDGAGFADLEGMYSDTELSANDLGPASLRTRVRDLGGVISLKSSSSGAEVCIEFPL